MNNNIGIFDSGYGGISALNQCIKLMPHQNFIYLGDSINAPFGIKAISELTLISDNIIKTLQKYNIDTIIIACNTISTNLYGYLCEKYPKIHFIPTLPSFRPILKSGATIQENNILLSIPKKSTEKKIIFDINHNKKKLLVIGTTATIRSSFIKSEIKAYEMLLDAYIESADPIVSFVENGDTDSIDLRLYLKELFKEYMDIDYLILGCTHFPFVNNAIKEIVGEKVQIIDPSIAVAEELSKYVDTIDNNSNTPIIEIIDSAIDNNRISIYKKLINTSNHEMKFMLF